MQEGTQSFQKIRDIYPEVIQKEDDSDSDWFQREDGDLNLEWIKLLSKVFYVSC